MFHASLHNYSNSVRYCDVHSCTSLGDTIFSREFFRIHWPKTWDLPELKRERDHQYLRSTASNLLFRQKIRERAEDTIQNFNSPSPLVILKSRAFFSRRNSRLPAVYGCVSHSTTPVTQPLAKFVSIHSILPSSNIDSVIKRIREGTFALTFESEKCHPSISAEWLTPGE